MTIHSTIAAMAFGTLVSLLIAVGHAQVGPPLSEVKVIVFDETGAAIPDCELVFKSNSEATVSHTGMDGSVTLRLQSGRYVVTISKAGFVKSKMLDVQIVTPMMDALRVVLKVDHTPTDGPIFDGVPTTTSDVPGVVGPESSGTPSVQRATRKSRSWQCLYLWKCSTS